MDPEPPPRRRNSTAVEVPDGPDHRPVPAGRPRRRHSAGTQEKLVGQVDADVELDVEVVGDDGAAAAVVGRGVGEHPTTDDRRPEAASGHLDEVEQIKEDRRGRTSTADMAGDAVGQVVVDRLNCVAVCVSYAPLFDRT